MPTGQYSLEVARKGYVKTERSFTINDASTAFLSITLPVKKFNRASAIVYSTLFPGMGQFYSQRNRAGVGIMAAALLSSAATGYFFYETESLAKDYNEAKSEYFNELDIGLIPEKREEMDGAYQSYQDAVKMRDLTIGITAGIWIVNIIDAAIFAKMYEPVLQGSIGEQGSYRLTPSPGIHSIGASLSLKF